MAKKLTPVKAIRKRCLDCVGFSTTDVKNCNCFENDGAIEKCFLHPYRMGKRPKVKAECTPIKSIRKHCLWCCCGSFNLVKNCPTGDCPLWIYRFGTNPARKGVGNNSKMPSECEKVAVEKGVFDETSKSYSNALTK
jgi:hypothetical protein